MQAYVTQPWIKWFNFVNGKIETFSTITSDPWAFDFSSEDFWSNVSGPGAGSWDIVNAEANHPGIQRLRTDVANGDITTSFFPVAAAGALRWDQISTVILNVKTSPTITTCRFEGGITSDPPASWPATVFEAGNDMVYFFYDTNTDNALHIKVRASGVTTQNLTVVNPCPADTWLKFVFQRRLVQSNYVLDLLFKQGDVPDSTGLRLVSTVNTGLPSNSAAFGGMFRVGTRVAAARDLYVDRFLMPPPTNLTR